MIVKYIMLYTFEKPEGCLSKFTTAVYTDTSIDNLLTKAMRLQTSHISVYDYLYSSVISIFAITKDSGEYALYEKPEYYSYYNGADVNSSYLVRAKNIQKYEEIEKRLEGGRWYKMRSAFVLYLNIQQYRMLMRKGYTEFEYFGTTYRVRYSFRLDEFKLYKVTSSKNVYIGIIDRPMKLFEDLEY